MTNIRDIGTTRDYLYYVKNLLEFNKIAKRLGITEEEVKQELEIARKETLKKLSAGVDYANR